MGFDNFKKPPARIFIILIIIVIGFAFLGLSSYVYRIGSATSSRATPTNQRPATISPWVAITETQPTATPIVSDYRTVLLLERATDLIVTSIEMVKAEQITPDNADARYAYTDALPTAIDAYNQTIPSPGMSSAWKNV